MEGLGDPSDTLIEVATSFAASMGMALYKNNVKMEDRVRRSTFGCLPSIDEFLLDH